MTQPNVKSIQQSKTRKPQRSIIYINIPWNVYMAIWHSTSAIHFLTLCIINMQIWVPLGSPSTDCKYIPASALLYFFASVRLNSIQICDGLSTEQLQSFVNRLFLVFYFIFLQYMLWFIHRWFKIMLCIIAEHSGYFRHFQAFSCTWYILQHQIKKCQHKIILIRTPNHSCSPAVQLICLRTQ